MSERYSKLFSLPANLYAAGAPVVVAAGALLKDNQTGNVLVQLKLQNIDRRQIKAAAVEIFPMDTAGDALAETTTYQYLDLRAGRDAFFGQKTAIQLPNAATRSFSVAVTEVVFSDNGKWTAMENVWEPLPVPTPVDRWGDLELATQFQIDYGARSENLPLEEKDIWFCVCGTINHKGETNCHSCGQLLSRLREIDLDELRKEKDERLQRERADAERRRMEEAAARQRRNRLIITFATVAALIAIVCFSVNFVKKNGSYKEAVALMDQGRYEEAAAIFSGLGNFKDAQSKADGIIIYNDALECLEQGDDSGAYTLFQQVPDYMDSSKYLAHFHYVPVTETCLHHRENYPDWGYLSELFSTSTGQIIREKVNYQGTDSKYPYHEVEYVYDSEGQKTKCTEYFYVNNTSQSYEEMRETTYDKAGNIIIEKTWRDGKWSDRGESYVLNEDGTLKEKSLQGARYVYHYENARTKSIDVFWEGGERTDSYSYAFDSNGNMIRKEETYCIMGTWMHMIDEYTYDDDSRLFTHQSIDGNTGFVGGEWTYSYDWVYFPEND